MKKTIVTLGIMLAAAVAAWASRVEPYTGSRIFWDTATRTTVISGGGYGRIIQLQDGRLMAVCESSGIKIAFSQDKGATWNAATKIVENTNNTPNCVPDLIQLSDGTIIVAYNPRPSQPYTEDRKFGIRCKRSTDGGKTWSDEIFVNDARHTFDDGCWEPSLLQLPSGEVQLYFADEGPYTANNDQQISLCRSFDGGLTWTAAQKISYRAGFRDGMPVPVLLKDQSAIVVAIEDNGWGYGDFYPTTVRTTLSQNWQQGYWVRANDPNREQMLNTTYAPRALGGAPYLRVLPWGETVMSHQSAYDNDSRLRMRVAVGNAEARDFKAVSTPFALGATEQGLWNSLAVIDTGIVVAVSGIQGNVEMIKGYPVRQLRAPYGHPAIDGKQTAGEGYLTRTGTQILLGSQTGTRVAADLAYDEDSLYFFSRISDRTQVPNGANCDQLTLLFDALDTSDTAPQEGCSKVILRMDGTVYRLQLGRSGLWANADKSLFPLRTAVSQTASYYIMETAIPWTALGLTSAPTGKRLAFAMEYADSRSGTVYTETIPDADPAKPFTWMELRLGEMPKTNTATSQDISIVQLADPFILLDGDTYYAYGTNDANGIAYWTSTDLRGWRKANELALHKDNTTETQSFWAPEVYCRDGQYYMYYTANEHLYVATAASPRGPFRQVGGRMMQNTLGDEKCIDSTVFFDDNGRVYLFFVRFTDGNCIWMCELEDDLVTPKPETLRRCISASQSWEQLLGRVNEGPFVLKQNGIYYLTYSGNDYRSQDYAVGYAQTRSLSTTAGATPSWTKYANNPIVRRVENLVGTGHHSFFTDKEGRLRIVFHAHMSETVVNPRRMYIGTMEFVGNRLVLADEPIIRPTTPGRVGIVDATATSDRRPLAVYDLCGRRSTDQLAGLRLVRLSDGSVRKTF